jgi:hypothetical protein
VEQRKFQRDRQTDRNISKGDVWRRAGEEEKNTKHFEEQIFVAADNGNIGHPA